MAEYQREIAESIKNQDETELALGDTLDVKASIALVVIIFLATQSADFLKSSPPLSPAWHHVQVWSVFCLIAAGVCAFFELLPRQYEMRMSPAEFIGWVNKLADFYKGDPDAESKISQDITDTEIKKIEKRFSANSAINARKSLLLDWCFRFTAAALAFNLATLLRLAFR